MEEETDEERYTLTSFEPLSPEHEKPSFFRSIGAFAKKKLTGNAHDRQPGHETSTRVEKAPENGTQLYPKKQNFIEGLPTPRLEDNNHSKWKANDSKFGSRLPPRPKTPISSNRNTRTPSSVLRRLSLLVLVDKTSQQQSKSSNDLKQYWMPDEQCKVCYECGVKFNTFRRRHHCRLCGQIFCSRCCNEELSGQQIGYTGVFRVCVYCKKIVLTYTSSSDVENNLKQLKEDLSLVAQPDCTNSPASGLHGRNTFDVLGVSAEEANLLKQDSLKDLWLQITAPKVGLECHSHRMRLRTYSNCLVGRELVDWLMVHRKAQNRCQAIQVCQGLQDSGWIEPLVGSRELEFKDDFASLYIPGPSATGESSFPGFRATTPLLVHENLTASNNSDDFFIKRRYYKEKCEVGSALSVSYDQRFTEKGREGFHKSHSTSKIRNMEPFVAEPQNRSSSCEEVFLKVDIVENIFSKENQSIRSQSPSAGARAFTSQQATVTVGNADGDYQDVDKVTANDLSLPVTPEESDENAAFQQLGSIHRQHFSSFLVQLLDRVHLSQSWKEIIEPLVVKVSETVTPDVAHDDDMDIRQYVKIKKIPEGEKSACRIVSGVVCTKNVVHKKMVKSITQPLILMLTCPVDFHRVENKLASLDPLVLQEEEFLKNYVGRIVALKPTLVLVEKTVSRLAKDMLLSKGISVILNVKPKLMAKISRCTEGDVLPSLDQGSRPRLGTCQNFKIEKFVFKNGSTKTLAFFEGCNPRLGSTIVLRGANVAELSRVRDILKFMLYVAYNSKLEKAFVMDEFGTPFRQEQIENVKENGETGVENENERSFGNESEGVEEVGSENVASSDEDVKFQISPKKESEQMEKGLKHEETSEKDEQCLKAIAVFNEKTVSIEDNSTEEKNKGNVVNCESFKKVLDSIILCSSPLITYPVPYILTSEGQRCELLAYMPDDLYWSPMFSDSLSDGRCSPDEDCTDSGERPESRNIFVKETHPFVFAVLKKDAGEVQELLAHYRAQGGKITLKNHSNVSYKVKDESVFIPCQNESDGLGKAVDVPDGVADTFHRKNCDNGRRDEQFSVTLPSMKDCFDPFFHQMIAILFSSYCSHSSNFPHPCISPWTVFMEFYAKNDIALGCFLERYCFRSSYVCPNTNCDVPMVQHVRYFAHGNGAVYINMKNLEAPIPGFSTTLLTWSWCKVCKQVTPVVPVSPEAWRLSFAKYLELRMYGTCYGRRSTDAPCSHSLHQDHYQYFAFNNIVASFKYIPVKIFEVHLPPSAITLLEEERQPQFWVKHIQEMSVRVHHLVNLINDRIASLKTESFISNCVTDIGHDKGQLYEKIKVLESKSMLLLNPPSSPDETNDNKLLEPHEILGLEYEILDGLTLLKRMMCQYGEKWNTQLLELHQLENEKKKYKTIDGRSSSSTQVISQSPVDSISSSQMTSDSVFNNWYSSSVPPVESAIDSEIVVIPDNQDTLKTTQEDSQPQDVTNSANLSAQTLVDEEQTSSSSDESETKIDALNGPRGISTSCEKKIQRHSELWATLSREVNSTLKDAQFLEDPPGPKMKRIISRVLPGVNFRPIPSPFPPHQHHLLPTSELIPIVVNEKEPTSIIAYTLSTVDYRKKLHEIQDSMLDMESDGESFTCIDVEADGACRLSTQSPTRNRTRSEAETISSTSLMTKLDDFVDNYFDCSESDDEENGLKNNATKDKDDPSDVKTDEDVKRDEDSVTDGKEQPSTFNSSSQEDVEYHIRHSFSDSSAKFFCVVYFGEQFRRIRKTVFPEGEEKYVRSLQHCLTWRATGGKSGSSFSKTTDDRFVIKGMSRPEAQSFLNIAPYYFQYIDKAINEKRPTLLAKIVGVYRIGCTSKTTNTPIREDLLVMDNLLYNCKVDQVFDLKGSIRSRYVMSEEGNSVLMDENLLEMISDSPLFIRPHSKAVLSRAINQDTEFLARHMVMDYSLLLGIERDSSRLIVGIIDFIRTFTWDKKLEMYVKSTGILGGQGKMPTVVSPELYRERFCEAMQRYFLMIPNKWIGLGNELK